MIKYIPVSPHDLTFYFEGEKEGIEFEEAARRAWDEAVGEACREYSTRVHNLFWFFFFFFFLVFFPPPTFLSSF